jgi:hypothetical protein
VCDGQATEACIREEADGGDGSRVAKVGRVFALHRVMGDTHGRMHAYIFNVAGRAEELERVVTVPRQEKLLAV